MSKKRKDNKKVKCCKKYKEGKACKSCPKVKISAL